MPNDAFSQQALANDVSFQKRVANAGATVAWQVLGEDTATVNHPARATYAISVLNSLLSWANLVAKFLVIRPNVINFTTSVSLDQGVLVVVTTSGDADLISQIATDWNSLIGILPKQ